MDLTNVRLDELKAQWDSWTTQECQDEFDEMSHEVVEIAAKLKGAGTDADQDWRRRARMARRFVATEHNALARYLKARKAADRAKAHEAISKNNPFPKMFMRVAKSILSADVYERLIWETETLIDREARVSAVAEHKVPGRYCGVPLERFGNGSDGLANPGRPAE